MMKDPVFLADAKRRKLAISPRSHTEVAALAEKIVGASPEFVAKVAKAVGAPN